MKLADVKPSTYIGFNKENNQENPKFKAGNHGRTSKYENIFEIGYTPNWFEEVVVIKNVKNTVLWTYVISDLNVEEIVQRFYQKQLQKQIKKSLKLIK